MGAGDLLRLLLIVVGISILSTMIVSLARKNMTESFCIFWGIVSLLFIVSGIVLRPVEWNRYISYAALIIIFCGVAFIVVAALYFSVRISRLIRQSTELAIQVSLLNQENEILLRELKKEDNEFVTTGVDEYEEKDLIYY